MHRGIEQDARRIDSAEKPKRKSRWKAFWRWCCLCCVQVGDEELEANNQSPTTIHLDHDDDRLAVALEASPNHDDEQKTLVYHEAIHDDHDEHEEPPPSPRLASPPPLSASLPTPPRTPTPEPPPPPPLHVLDAQWEYAYSHICQFLSLLDVQRLGMCSRTDRDGVRRMFLRGDNIDDRLLFALCFPFRRGDEEEQRICHALLDRLEAHLPAALRPSSVSSSSSTCTSLFLPAHMASMDLVTLCAHVDNIMALQLLQQLYQLRAPLSALIAAAGQGHTRVLRLLMVWTRQQGDAPGHNHNYEDREVVAVCCAAAAAGRVEALQVLRDPTVPGGPWAWDSSVAAAAAAEGQMTVLQWLDDRKCPIDATVAHAAARSGHLDVLDFLLSSPNHSRIVLSTDTIAAAAAGGQLHVLHWLRVEHDCPWDESAVASAAAHDQLAALQWLVNTATARVDRCPIDASATLAACAAGHVCCIVFLRSEVSPPCPWHTDCLKVAAKCGRLAMLHFMFDGTRPACKHDHNASRNSHNTPQYDEPEPELEHKHQRRVSAAEDPTYFSWSAAMAAAAGAGQSTTVQWLLDHVAARVPLRLQGAIRLARVRGYDKIVTMLTDGVDAGREAAVNVVDAGHLFLTVGEHRDNDRRNDGDEFFYTALPDDKI